MNLVDEEKIFSLTDDRFAWRIDDTGGKEMEIVLDRSHHHRVAGVISSLKKVRGNMRKE